MSPKGVGEMRKSRRFLLFGFLISLTILAGCGKAQSGAFPAPEPTQQPVSTPETTAQPQDPRPPQPETAPAPDYGPNPWAGVYITADPSIEADPKIWDSMTMDLPEGCTRRQASDSQIDFVMDGVQAGGILLVDLPGDLLDQAAESREGHTALADYLAKQVMPDVYPSRAHLNGGGKPWKEVYTTVFVETNTENGIRTQYLHRIYLGEQYCYDFWIDEGLWNDTGYTISKSLSSEDIKLELNDVEYA